MKFESKPDNLAEVSEEKEIKPEVRKRYLQKLAERIGTGVLASQLLLAGGGFIQEYNQIKKSVGVESLEGETGEAWQKILNGLPKGVVGEVESSRIKFLPQESAPRAGYQFLDSAPERRVAGRYERTPGLSPEIRIYNDPSDKEFLFHQGRGVLIHELGHANSWDEDEELNKEEREALHVAVSKRIHAENRHLSTYVESLEDDDAKKQEYWAEIFKEYFVSPNDLSYEDFILVDRVVRKQDPDFNLLEYVKTSRETLVQVYNPEMKAEKVKKNVKLGMESSNLEEKLNELLRLSQQKNAS